MSLHQRRLPHWYPDDKALFVTFNLHGSIPRGLYPPGHKLSAGEAFVWMDRYLDTTRQGPKYLNQDHLAQLVRDSLYTGEQLGHYTLQEWVIMPNHVHLLLTPKIHPTKLLGSLKGKTAREANKLLRRTGEPFWQAESYDHWVRNNEEFRRIAKYIADNPVKAGLALEPQQFRWSGSYGRPEESGRGGL